MIFHLKYRECRTGALTGAVLIVALLMWPSAATAAKSAGDFHKVSEILIDSGISALDKEKLDDARQTFEQAVVADPSNAKAFSYLGYAHYRKGDRALAKKYFSIALDIDPNERHALSWGGQVDLAAADLEGAEAKLLRLSRLCGTDCSEYKILSDAVSSYKTKAN